MRGNASIYIAVLAVALSFWGCGKQQSDDRSNPPASSSEQVVSGSGGGQIAGFVFEDKNRNGIFDADDVRLPQQQVVLTSPDGKRQIQAATTGNDGGFQFDHLVATDYRISLHIPAGYVRTNDDSFVRTVTEREAMKVDFGVAPQAR